MTKRAGGTVLGPAVFAVVLAAVLVFFWWFLIADHGVGPPG